MSAGRAADRRLLRASRAARVHLVTAVALGVATAAALVAQAALLAMVVDRVVLHGASIGDVSSELVAFLAVTAVRGGLAAGFDISGRLGAALAMTELRARLVDHLLVVRPGGLRRERTGELAAAAVQGVDALEAYFARYLPQLVLAALVPPAVLAFLAPRDPVAVGVLALTLPLIPLFMVLIGRAAGERTRARWRALSLLSGHFLDVMRGLDTLRAANRAEAQAETMANIGDRLRRETMGTLKVAFLSALVLELLAMLGVALVAATVGVQLAAGDLSLAAGLTVLILAPELYAPLREVGTQFHASADGLASARTIFDLLDAPAAASVPAASTAAPDPRRAPVILDRVSLAYPEREGAVLDAVGLSLAPGELVAVVGASGAGKTTLAALLLRLVDPGSGAVRCNGVDLREVDPRAWRARCAWVPQRPRLFTGTVADNVRLGAPDAADAQVRAALDMAGGLEFVVALPEGMDTLVGEGGRTVSAGQAQRVCLSRAFVHEGSLLVLDEPTAHLDEGSAERFGERLAELVAGRTTLLISHRPELVARADRVLELAGGQLVEQPGEVGAAA